MAAQTNTHVYMEVLEEDVYKRQSLHIDGNFSLLGKKGNHFWREIIAQQTAQVEDLGLYMLQLQDEMCIRDSDNAAFDLRINRIPVYLIIIPLLIHLLAEENLHRRNLVLIGNHEHIIIRMKNRISLRNYPVSYTHLDVYKRQLSHSPTSHTTVRAVPHTAVPTLGAIRDTNPSA